MFEHDDARPVLSWCCIWNNAVLRKISRTEIAPNLIEASLPSSSNSTISLIIAPILAPKKILLPAKRTLWPVFPWHQFLLESTFKPTFRFEHVVIKLRVQWNVQITELAAMSKIFFSYLTKPKWPKRPPWFAETAPPSSPPPPPPSLAPPAPPHTPIRAPDANLFLSRPDLNWSTGAAFYLLNPPSSTFLLNEGKLQLNPNNPSPKDLPRTKDPNHSHSLQVPEQELAAEKWPIVNMRENGKTSLHRWWKSWSKPNTFVRHLAVPSSNQPHNSLKHERQVKPNLFWSNLQKKGSHLLYTPPLLVWRKNMPGEASYKSGRHWGNCWQMPCPTQPVIKYSSPQD